METSRAGRSSENEPSSGAFWGGLGGFGRRSRQEIPSIAKTCSTPADGENAGERRKRFTECSLCSFVKVRRFIPGLR